MDGREAKDLLLLHGLAHDALDHPKAETGFLGSLRPYRGLDERNFYEVMQAIEAISDGLRNDVSLDREAVDALWGICAFARHWRVSPNGMLRRNGLISLEDSTRLEGWIDTITYTVAMLLSGASFEEAFSFANEGDDQR